MASEVYVVLISGCSSGIGLDTALHLAKDPEKRFKVYATMRNLAKKKGKLEEHGKEYLGKTLVIEEMDVSSDESVKNVVEKIIEIEERIDVLFNNAGYGIFGVLETIPVEKAKQLFDVNFFGVLRAIQAVLPYMKKKRSGLILNNSSVFGLVGAPFYEVYSASKFALEGLIESLAPTLLYFDIRCALIEPGPVASSFRENLSTHIKSFDKVKADEESLELIKAFKAKAGKRVASFEQTGDEIAKMVEEIILCKNPKLRYPTNDKYNPDERAAKYSDLAGEGLPKMLKKNYFE
ncbi:retinol dehydrogenase 8-like [Montipora capricornis]|uniref:retinol dehydrogenase 8-like n=1 Tax=Montipora capricornis TaxID=246305 RepID=UPI0035F1F91B